MNRKRDIFWQAHRGGGASEAPDNTLSAFRYTWGLGGIPEADIRMTLDGVFVCLHDETIARTTTAPVPQRDIPVSELEFQEIRRWDAGVKFHDHFRGEQIPSLQEVFTNMQGKPDRQLYLDAKAVDLDELGCLLYRSGVKDQVIFTHNSMDCCRKIKEIIPDVKCMLWIGGSADQIKRTFQAVQSAEFAGLDQVQLHLNPHPEQVSDWPYALEADFIANALSIAEEAGTNLEVLPYRMDKYSIGALLDMGVSWFATDEPKHFLECVEDWNSNQR